MNDSYAAFLAGKAVMAQSRGLATVPPLAKHLFPFQREAVAFGLRAGSWACFLDTGLGKTACELEWCWHAAHASNGRALILTPLAVARQIEAEGKRWSYTIRVIREQAEAREGINVCNYDRLDKLDLPSFGAVALDESSILKAFTGKTTRALIEALRGHRWRMAATATPAPNDHMELGNHAECLGIMPQADMLARWFINDSTRTGQWRLKRHAVDDFWDWMTSWARAAEHPRDLGDDQAGFDLPPLRVHHHRVRNTAVKPPPGALFAGAASATGMHVLKRQTAEGRAAAAAGLVRKEPSDRWLLWTDTDYEADAVMAALSPLGTAVGEVRGSQPIATKESRLAAFDTGVSPILVSKPSVCGFGLNFQHTSRMIFVGRSFSYEAWYQAVRRCWRFGQRSPVDVHVIVAEGEAAIGRVLDRKAADHARMKHAMVAAMGRAMSRAALVRRVYIPAHEGRLPTWFASSATAKPKSVTPRNATATSRVATRDSAC